MGAAASVGVVRKDAARRARRRASADRGGSSRGRRDTAAHRARHCRWLSSAWKRQAVEGLEEVFSGPRAKGRPEHEETIRTLHAKLGELTVERDFFLHGLGS